MPNSWFNASGDPITRSRSASVLMRNAFAGIAAAFDRLPNPLGAGVQGFSGGSFVNPVITNPTVQGGTLGSSASPSVGVASLLLLGAGTGYAAGSLPVESGTLGAFFRMATTNFVGYARSNSGTPVVSFFFDDKRSFVMGDGANALATSATEGFFYLPAMAGVASGAPAAYTGAVATVYDTTNHKIGVRSGGTWRWTGALS